MKRILLVLLGLLPLTPALAETYSLYILAVDETETIDQPSIKLVDLLKKPGIHITSFIQTEAVSDPEDPGTVRTYKISYPEEFDIKGTPVKTTEKEIGTRFRVEENGDSFSFSFTHSEVEDWIDYPPNGHPVPVSSSISSDSELTLKSAIGVLLGALGAYRTDPSGEPVRFWRQWIIVKGEPATAIIEIPDSLRSTPSFQNPVIISPGGTERKPNPSAIEIEIEADTLKLDGKPLSREELLAELQDLPRNQPIVVGIDASLPLEAHNSVVLELYDQGFTQISTTLKVDSSDTE